MKRFLKGILSWKNYLLKVSTLRIWYRLTNLSFFLFLSISSPSLLINEKENYTIPPSSRNNTSAPKKQPAAWASQSYRPSKQPNSQARNRSISYSRTRSFERASRELPPRLRATQLAAIPTEYSQGSELTWTSPPLAQYSRATERCEAVLKGRYRPASRRQRCFIRESIL